MDSRGIPIVVPGSPLASPRRNTKYTSKFQFIAPRSPSVVKREKSFLEVHDDFTDACFQNRLNTSLVAEDLRYNVLEFYKSELCQSEFTPMWSTSPQQEAPETPDTDAPEFHERQEMFEVNFYEEEELTKEATPYDSPVMESISPASKEVEYTPSNHFARMKLWTMNSQEMKDCDIDMDMYSVDNDHMLIDNPQEMFSPCSKKYPETDKRISSQLNTQEQVEATENMEHTEDIELDTQIEEGKQVEAVQSMENKLDTQQVGTEREKQVDVVQNIEEAEQEIAAEFEQATESVQNMEENVQQIVVVDYVQIVKAKTKEVEEAVKDQTPEDKIEQQQAEQIQQFIVVEHIAEVKTKQVEPINMETTIVESKLLEENKALETKAAETEGVETTPMETTSMETTSMETTSVEAITEASTLLGATTMETTPVESKSVQREPKPSEKRSRSVTVTPTRRVTRSSKLNDIAPPTFNSTSNMVKEETPITTHGTVQPFTAQKPSKPITKSDQQKSVMPLTKIRSTRSRAKQMNEDELKVVLTPKELKGGGRKKKPAVKLSAEITQVETKPKAETIKVESREKHAKESAMDICIENGMVTKTEASDMDVFKEEPTVGKTDMEVGKDEETATEKSDMELCNDETPTEKFDMDVCKTEETAVERSDMDERKAEEPTEEQCVMNICKAEEAVVEKINMEVCYNETTVEKPDKKISKEETIEQSEKEKEISDKRRQYMERIADRDRGEIKVINNKFPSLSHDYELLERAGYGSFSRVYKAIDLNAKEYEPIDERFRDTDDFVAIKMIYDISSPARVFREINCLIKLRGSPCVTPLITAFRNGGLTYVVLPYIRFDHFEEFFRKMTLSDIRSYLTQILTGLKSVHALGIMHRDIKPGNFLYNFSSKLGYVADFGLAQEMPHYPREQLNQPTAQYIDEQEKAGFYVNDSRPNFICNRSGTKGFRAPEILLKYGRQTTAIDIWAVGVIFCIILCGNYPFFEPEDDADGLLELIQIFGMKKIREFVAYYGRTIKTNIPGLPEKELNLAAYFRKYNKNIEQWDNEEYLQAIDLLKRMLELVHTRRIDATDALQHPFLKRESS